MIKKIICFFLGHDWWPYNFDYNDPYCARCGKHTTIEELVKDAFK